MLAIAIIGVIAYVVTVISVWRVATYLCLAKPWLTFVPIANIIYFCYVADDLSVEAKSCESSYSSTVCTIALAGTVITMTINIIHINVVTSIALLIFTIALLITLSYAYACYIVEGLEHASLVLLASLVIPFPVFLLWASFGIPEKVEEVLELYL